MSIAILDDLMRTDIAPLARATDFTPRTFEFSFRRTIEGWAGDAAGWSEPRAPRDDRSAIAVLPSNSPAPLMNVTASAWLAGIPLAIKPSRVDRDFALAWIAFAQKHFPGLRIAVVEQFDPAVPDYLVVFGSDETVTLLRDSRGRSEGFIGYGHKYSLAYVEDASRETAAKAADDIVAWDQSGCLSPQIAYVTGGRERNFAERLADELAERQERFPRRAVSPAVSLAIRALRMNVRMRPDGRVFSSEKDTSWTVLCDTLPSLESTPLERTIWIKPIDDGDHLRKITAGDHHHIEAIGVAASAHRFTDMQRGESVADRIVPLGRMQSPTMSRRHGAIEPLWRLLNSELKKEGICPNVST